MGGADRALTGEYLLQLLEAFEQAAPELLLFLPSLARIETYVWRDGEARPARRFFCTADSSASPEARSAFWPSHPPKEDWVKAARCSFGLQISWQHFRGEVHTENWKVASRFGGGDYAYFQSPELAGSKQRFVPYSAVAIGDRRERGRGRVFCFLPVGDLPTGDAVHVHGFFALSTNRRDIVWGGDLTDDAANKRRWNEYIFFRAVIGLPVLPAADGTWRKAAEALQASGPGGVVKGTALWDYLAASGLPLVDLPQHVLDGFCAAGAAIRVASADDVAKHISSLKSTGTGPKPSPQAAAELLEYFAQHAKTLVTKELVGALWLPIEGRGDVRLLEGSGAAGGPVYLLRRAGGAASLDVKLALQLFPQLAPSLVDSELSAVVVSWLDSNFVSAGAANVRHLSTEWLADLLPMSPMAALHGQQTALGKQAPPAAWFNLFWRFVALDLGTDLRKAGTWPLVQRSDGSFVALSPSRIQFIDSDLSAYSSAAEILSSLGVSIVSTAAPQAHDLVAPYCSSVNASNVARALGEAAASSAPQAGLAAAVAQLPPKQRLLLRDLFAALLRAGAVGDGGVAVNLIRPLPLLATYGSNQKFMAASAGAKLAPEGLKRLVNGESFIREQDLAGFLTVQRASFGEYVHEHLLPCMAAGAADEVHKACIELLEHLPNLPPDIRSTLSNAPIITVKSGSKLVAPSQLYDPEVADLRALLGESHFPAGMYADRAVLALLREWLDLRRVLSAEDAVEIARSVEQAAQQAAPSGKKKKKGGIFGLFSSDNKALQAAVGKARALLAYLVKHSDDIQWDLTQLRDIRFLPPKERPSSLPAGAPWRGPPQSWALASPAESRPFSQAPFCSASKVPVDTGIELTPAIVERLGWAAGKGELAWSQLVAIREAHGEGKLRPGNVASLLGPVYEALNDDVRGTSSKLTEEAFIWSGSDFLPASLFAIAGLHNLDATPFLLLLPPSIATHSNLVSAAGVRASWSMSDYVGVLAAAHSQSQGTAFSTDEIQLFASILSMVQAHGGAEAFAGTALFVPGVDSRLHPPSACLFNDSPSNSVMWNQLQAAGTGDYVMLHELLPRPVAALCGVRMLSEYVFSASIVEEEPFEIREPPAARITGIVGAYGHETVPIRELLQNAGMKFLELHMHS
eukprot:tig00000057_g43.t1